MRTFVGFGFGAIQGGLFLLEAHRSGAFDRLVVAEVVEDVVSAVRGSGGRYWVNVAAADGIERHEVSGVEIFNPREEGDREQLAEAVASAQEMATALPSVDFYGSGDPGDVVSILAEGFRRKAEDGPSCVVYTAENNNHAAEELEARLTAAPGGRPGGRWQCLNTVIGKMSGVVTDPDQLQEQGLAPAVEGGTRAFLVEAFNRILVTRICHKDFVRGISVFEEKEDLLPFEEAKLFGHNAVHALVGYLLRRGGGTYMSEARDDASLMAVARDAFLEESGAALCRRHSGVDELFTPAGFVAYADDLLVRMFNPFLRDTVERVTRDPRRKLGWDDRLVGTMRMILGQGLEPALFARGAAAALEALVDELGRGREAGLDVAWRDADVDMAEANRVKALIGSAGRKQ